VQGCYISVSGLQRLGKRMSLIAIKELSAGFNLRRELHKIKIKGRGKK